MEKPKRDHIKKDGFEDIQKLTLNDFYDPTLNASFMSHNSDTFFVNNYREIEFSCNIEDLENPLYDGKFIFQAISLGLAFERYAACLLSSLSMFPNQRYSIIIDPVAGVFFQLFCRLLSEKEEKSIKNHYENKEIFEEVITHTQWIKKEIPDYPLTLDDLFGRLEDDETAAELLCRQAEIIRRGSEAFGESNKYIMQFPKRYKSLWVINCSSCRNYSDEFMYKWSVNCENMRFSPILDDRPYSWFLDVFLGTDDNAPLFPLLSLACPNIYINNKLLDTILADGDIHYVDLWNCAIWGAPNSYIIAKYDLPLWLSFLKYGIQTEFISEWEMNKKCPDYITPLIKRAPAPDDTIINVAEIMETLGYYDSKEKKIYICPERIIRVSEELNYDVLSAEMLFYIVYIHELSHAAMDESLDAGEIPEDYYRDASYYLKTSENTPFSLSDKCANYMEESLANLITLNCLNWYSEISEDQRYYDAAYMFIQQQSPMYSFGIEQFEACVDWTKWREYKQKNPKDNEKLWAWYNKYFDEDGQKRIDYNYSKADFDEIFI